MSQSVGKALQILVQLGAGPANLDQLAAALDVHKTTVLRLLRTLADEHFVFRDGSHRYHLGARIHELSSRGLEQREVRSIAAPHLIAFNRAHGRTTHLSELAGTEIVYIDKLESHDHVRMASRIGLRAPVHSTAAGKVLLADLPRERVVEIVATHGLPSYTRNTITDLPQLEVELERIRLQGYAIDDEEYDEGLRCIGAGVRDHSGRVVSALGIGGPVTRITPERVQELAELVMTAAAGLSRRLGAHQSGAYAPAALRVRTTPSEPLFGPSRA